MVSAITLSSSLFALSDSAKAVKEIPLNGATFSIAKSDTGTIYSMVRNNVNDISKISLTGFLDTKQELSMLGMETDQIEKLDYNDLVRYATCKNIIASVSYIKTNENRTQEYISEATALRESAIANNGDSKQQNQVSDDYMRIWHCVTHIEDEFTNSNSGLMHFETSARWLTMPTFRGIDSLASCASNCTVIGSSVNYGIVAYTEYDCTVFSGIPGDYYVDENYRIYHPVEPKILTEGSFTGTGFTFDLPNDEYDGTSPSHLYSDFVAYFGYYGHVSNPELATYFNSKGNYSHSYVYIGVTPSIGFSDENTIGLDFSIVGSKEDRGTFIEFHYVP